jgi:2-keto-4-pentenoate hydratase
MTAADALYAARRDLRPVPPLRETHGLASAEDAYAVQEANTRRWLGEGRRLAGRKIGLTAKSVQAQLGVAEPDYGMLWADLGFVDGAELPAGRFAQPKVETEIAFVMARDLPDAELGFAAVAAAVDCVLAAVEIVDSAIADWNIRLVDTIADNASGGGYVLGTDPKRLGAVDLRLCGMVTARNGEAQSFGAGAACLGHPLVALHWLARRMAEVGRPLQAGDLVLSGALGPMLPAAAGDRFTAEIQGFAPISFRFAP